MLQWRLERQHQTAGGQSLGHAHAPATGFPYGRNTHTKSLPQQSRCCASTECTPLMMGDAIRLPQWRRWRISASRCTMLSCTHTDALLPMPLELVPASHRVLQECHSAQQFPTKTSICHIARRAFRAWTCTRQCNHTTTTRLHPSARHARRSAPSLPFLSRGLPHSTGWNVSRVLFCRRIRVRL